MREIAEEITRRVGASDGTEGKYVPYVVRLSEPPTAQERLQLMARRMLGRQVAIMPERCLTVAEWVERYGC